MFQFLRHSDLKGNNLVDGLVRAGTGWGDILPGITDEYRNIVSHVSRDTFLAHHNRCAID